MGYNNVIVIIIIIIIVTVIVVHTDPLGRMNVSFGWHKFTAIGCIHCTSCVSSTREIPAPAAFTLEQWCRIPVDDLKREIGDEISYSKLANCNCILSISGHRVDY